MVALAELRTDIVLRVQEDLKVLELVKKYGTKKWSLVGSFLQGRTGKTHSHTLSYLSLAC